MKLTKGSLLIASKLMSMFLTALIVSIYIYATELAPHGGDSLGGFTFVFFLVFSFLNLFLLPVSLLIETAKTWGSGGWYTLAVYSAVTLGSFGVLVGAWQLLFSWRLSHQVIAYGLATLFLFLLVDHLSSTIERNQRGRETRHGSV